MRTGLSASVASHVGYVNQAFGPRLLFQNGEQGWWYDPSDFSTLFQDAAGTTPVTAVEQPCGLMLDKRLGLVLGSNIVPSEISNALWVTIAGAPASTVLGDELTFGGQFSGRVVSDFNTQNGRRYKFTFTAKRISGNSNLHFFHEGSETGNQTAFTVSNTSAQYSCYVLGKAGGGLVRWGFQDRNASGWGTIEVSNISVRELPGNHAYTPAAASTARPTVSARYNLLTKTEQFDDAVWAKAPSRTEVIANQVVAPDGTLTGDLVRAITGSTTGEQYARQAVNLTSGVTYTFSCVIKKENWRYINIRAAGTIAIFDFDSESFTFSTGVTTTINNVGNGWYRVSVSEAASSTNPFFPGVGTAPSDVVNSWAIAPTNNQGVYVWGADFRVANDGVGIPAYQRVNTATDYDSSGFPVYLRADGSNDYLLTNSIDFTGTDKMTVCAGVRKLSDAATQMLVELSVASESNNGSFNLITWNTSGSFRLQAVSRGTISVTNAGTTSAAYNAPVSLVLTSIYDISGDSIVVRANSLQAASSTSDQGTGNYGNYQMFLFMRAGTSLPFNGRFYGGVVRGAQSNDQQIAALEGYMNNLTKAY